MEIAKLSVANFDTRVRLYLRVENLFDSDGGQ